MKSDPILLNKLHFPVTTLGPGNRIGVWFQGCSIRCPGCISKDTWEFSTSTKVQIEEAYEALARWIPQSDGLTVSGGEPFDQPGALDALLSWFGSQAGDRDVLVFSGYDFATLRERHAEILGNVDALVSGPFMQTASHRLGLRGSDNQELHLLSCRGRERFREERSVSVRSLDVFEDERGLWFAGIPDPADWRELERRVGASEQDVKRPHRGC